MYIFLKKKSVCHCSMFCCTLLYVHSSSAIILMGKRELVDFLSLSSWCLVIAVWLFLVVPWVCLQFVIVVFLDHTHNFCFNVGLPNFAQKSTLNHIKYRSCVYERYKYYG